MFFGTEIEAHTIGPRPKPGRGSPVGMGILAFIAVSVLGTALVMQNVAGVSIGAAVAAGVISGLAGGAAAYRLAKRIQGQRRAREAQEAYEMQRNRAAEAERQIAEMKRKAAKAEGIE
jgi:membrane associated rhomboid family serine protease